VFRGARAALKLCEWTVCKQLVQQGLELDPGAQELLQIRQVRVGCIAVCYCYMQMLVAPKCVGQSVAGAVSPANLCARSLADSLSG
jgi:hypothetical protein